MATLTSGTSIPGYTIIRKIGVGGSARVYLAVQQNLNRRVALKLVTGTFFSDPKFGERFKREGRIIAQLNHPQIIPVYDIGEFDGQYYMAMEYMSAGDLRSRAEQLTLNDLLQVILQITQALQVAHDRGFVHRDIKPANILFRNPKQAVLTDFGIARQTESLTQMTLTGAILGTPAYMSPEQIDGKTLDGRADLYSLGVTLFEMLTGYQPYRGESIMSVAMQHAHAEIPRLPPASTQLQHLVDRLLAKHPQDRISSAQALETELQDLPGLQEQLAAPLTSLWPDKAPENDGGPVFFAKTQGVQPGGNQSGKRSLIAASAALGLIAASGVAIWYVMDSPSAIESSIVSTGRIDSDRPALTDDVSLQQVPAQKPKPDVWQQTLAQANQLVEKGQLITPEDDNALALYRQVLQQDSANVMARNGEQNVLQRLVLEVEQLIVNQSLDKAEQQLATLKNKWPDEEKLQPLQQRISQSRKRIQASQLALQNAAKQREIDNNLQAATAAMIAGNYLKPRQDSALFFFNKTLSLEPGNKTALRGLAQISDALLAQIRTGISNNKFSRAESLLEDLRSVDARHPQLQSSAEDIAKAKTEYMQQQEQQQRLAELQTAIDKLADRISQWRLSSEGLDAQSSYGDQLIEDISRLLAEHADNSKLLALYESANQRLAELSARRQKELSQQQQKQPARKPIIGGF